VVVAGLTRHLAGQVPYRRTRAGVKVFCFFSSEKKEESSFSEEKEAKRL
jgi:hypothetical protein